MNLGAEPQPSTSATAEKAFSFISRGWREVRDSADADLELIKARANSFKKLATSFDRELENFLNSASTFSVPPAVRWSPSPPSWASQSPLTMVPASTSIAELEFVKKIQPKLTEFRQAYSSPDFSRKVLERWSPRARIRIDLSAIKNALVSEVEDEGEVLDLDTKWFRQKGRRVRWKVEQEEEAKEWELIRMLKTGLKEFERKSHSNDIFGNFRGSDFMEKVKLSLVCTFSFPFLPALAIFCFTCFAGPAFFAMHVKLATSISLKGDFESGRTVEKL